MDHSLSRADKRRPSTAHPALESRERLPENPWAVLIVGGIITVSSTCLFGVENFKLSLVQVFEISFLLSLMLVAIASTDRPFQGDVYVLP